MSVLINKTITTQRRCPKDHKVVKTFQIRDGKPVSYFFFCEKCNRKYTELQLTKSAAQKKAEKAFTKDVATESDKKEKNTITNADGPIKVIVCESDSIPKKCPGCHTNMTSITYILKGDGIKRKGNQLFGRECTQCHGRYLSKNLYLAHFQYFIRINQDPETETLAPGVVTISNKKGKISRNNENGPIKVHVCESDSIPKKCPYCAVDMFQLTYNVKEIGKKSKMLVGKECPQCHRIFFGETIYAMHSQDFIRINQESKTKNEKANKKEEHKAVNVSIKPIKQDDDEIKVQNIATDNEEDDTVPTNVFLSTEEINDEIQEDDQPVIIEEKNDTNVESNSTVTKETYTDDFGNEFDFSELSHLLNL